MIHICHKGQIKKMVALGRARVKNTVYMTVFLHRNIKWMDDMKLIMPDQELDKVLFKKKSSIHNLVVIQFWFKFTVIQFA